MIKTVLNAAKTAKGWSNQKLAEESGLPLSTVGNILGDGGKTENPRWDTVTQLARTLGVPLSALDEGAAPVNMPPTPNEAAIYYDAAKKYLIKQVAEERRERKLWQVATAAVVVVLLAVLILILLTIIKDINTPGIGWVQ